MRKRGVISGFSLIELLVVIGIIGILMAILLPLMEKVRHRGYIQACASNLRSIGQAMQVYAGENTGHFPRTTYVPSAPVMYGSGASASDPFSSAGPKPNDVTAALFLLIRTQKLPYSIFICPYNDVFVYEADRGDAQAKSNFTDVRKNLGYSVANPYPNLFAADAGYQWSTKFPASFALAADKNPGIKGNNDDVTAAVLSAPESMMEKARSGNHEKDGQNVLYADGHVDWQVNPLCGVNQDNIYTNQNGQIDQSPAGKDDSILLPTDDP